MNVEAMFLERDALLQGHFLLSSGLHSDRYLQCALVLALPDRAEQLGRALARRCAEKPDLVISPALGGLIIGQEVARGLGVRHYFAERQDGALTLRRGFTLRPGERALVVEDVLTTGKSTRELIELIRARGARAAGALSIVDRSEGRPGLDVPYASLWAVSIPAWTPDDCPRCRTGEPFVKPGSRTEKKNV